MSDIARILKGERFGAVDEHLAGQSIRRDLRRAWEAVSAADALASAVRGCPGLVHEPDDWLGRHVVDHKMSRSDRGYFVSSCTICGKAMTKLPCWAGSSARSES